MKVSLIGFTKPTMDGVSSNDVLYTAMSQCYNESFTMEDAAALDDEQKMKVLKHVLNSGHESVVEHINFTFLIEDVSRALTHQLVRHRIASYSQRSGRYTGLEHGEWYVIPPTIKRNAQALNLYVDTMKQVERCYRVLTDEMCIPKEDARFALPNGQFTNIAVTMNCRTLKNFFGLRLCTRAQWEIRDLAVEMAKICKETLPEVFKDCNYGEPKCVQTGYCVEQKKQWCRKMPHISELKKN